MVVSLRNGTAEVVARKGACIFVHDEWSRNRLRCPRRHFGGGAQEGLEEVHGGDSGAPACGGGPAGVAPGGAAGAVVWQ